MGLDMYLSARKRITRTERDLYYDIVNLFGMFSTEPDAKVSFYVSNWKHREKKSAESEQFHGIVDLFGLDGYVPDSSPSGNVVFAGTYPDDYIEVDMHVGYWRKANQIHAWFVNVVQGGVDECDPFDCTREQLQGLVDTCKTILNRTEVEAGNIHVGTRFAGGEVEEMYEEGHVIVDPSVAEELLPTQGGFFFGGTGYDEYYIQDLDETITQVEKALALPEDWTIFYQSSW